MITENLITTSNELTDLISHMCSWSFEVGKGILLDNHNIQYELEQCVSDKGVVKHCIDLLTALQEASEKVF